MRGLHGATLAHPQGELGHSLHSAPRGPHALPAALTELCIRMMDSCQPAGGSSSGSSSSLTSGRCACRVIELVSADRSFLPTLTSSEVVARLVQLAREWVNGQYALLVRKGGAGGVGRCNLFDEEVAIAIRRALTTVDRTRSRNEWQRFGSKLP